MICVLFSRERCGLSGLMGEGMGERCECWVDYGYEIGCRLE